MCSGAHAGLLRWSSTGATQGIAAAGVRNWYNNFARRAWCRWGFPLNSFCNESLSQSSCFNTGPYSGVPEGKGPCSGAPMIKGAFWEQEFRAKSKVETNVVVPVQLASSMQDCPQI